MQVYFCKMSLMHLMYISWRCQSFWGWCGSDMACQRLDQRTGPQLSHRLDLRSRVDLDFDSTYESGGAFLSLCHLLWLTEWRGVWYIQADSNRVQYSTTKTLRAD